MPTDPRLFIRFITEADLGRADVVGFDCGTAPWDQEVGEVLRSGKALHIHQPARQVTYLCLEHDDTGPIIGFFNYARKVTLLDRVKYNTLHITWFAVASQFQGQGFGTAIMTAILDDAKSSEMVLVDLFVHESNERAIRLYQRHDFEFLEGADFVDNSGRYRKMVCVLS